MSLDFPSAPTVGQTYPPYVWDGEKWDYVGQGAPGTANVKMSDTPPADAIPGDLWLETDTGFVFVMVDDGSSLQWAVTNPVMPVAGPKGDKGEQGDQGIQGIQGDQGIQGIPGDMTQANADLRYLKLTGGDLSGSIHAKVTTPGTDGNLAAQGYGSWVGAYDITTPRTVTGGGAGYWMGRGDMTDPTASRWGLTMDTSAESGSNAGSDFTLWRGGDDGASLPSPLKINRSSGGMTLSAGLTIEYASTNSVWLALKNTTSGAHNWSIAASGGGPSAIGSLTFYDNTSGGSLVNISGGSGHVTPGTTGTQNLGSTAARWGTVYTSDLSLSNGIGDWTIVEGEDDLFIYNNKRGKVYKFMLYEVSPETAPPKKA